MVGRPHFVYHHYIIFFWDVISDGRGSGSGFIYLVKNRVYFNKNSVRILGGEQTGESVGSTVLVEKLAALSCGVPCVFFSIFTPTRIYVVCTKSAHFCSVVRVFFLCVLVCLCAYIYDIGIL